MHKLFFILFSLSLFLFSCNDGDVLVVELEFDKILELCYEENIEDIEDLEHLNNYVIYDFIDDDPYESLTLLFPVTDANNLIFNPVDNPHTGSFNISGTVKFNYRTYDGDPLELICKEIPSSIVNIINDYEANSGKVNYTSTFEDHIDGKRTVTVVFTITNTDLEILSQDLIEFGTYTWTFDM